LVGSHGVKTGNTRSESAQYVVVEVLIYEQSEHSLSLRSGPLTDLALVAHPSFHVFSFAGPSSLVKLFFLYRRRLAEIAPQRAC
jgi:hypothetical protein